MKLIKIIRAYLNGNLVVVIKDENKFNYLKGKNIDKRFLCNSLTQVIKLNIN